MSNAPLQPSRLIRTVAMPRFRRSTAQSNRLSEVVNRALTRAFGPGGPFGIFVIDGKTQLVAVSTASFKRLQQSDAAVLVGTYDKSVRASDLLDDLSEFFSDEAA